MRSIHNTMIDFFMTKYNGHFFASTILLPTEMVLSSSQTEVVFSNNRIQKFKFLPILKVNVFFLFVSLSRYEKLAKTVVTVFKRLIRYRGHSPPSGPVC